jgi:hypothetical protein
MKFAACLFLLLLSGCAPKTEFAYPQERYEVWKSQKAPASWSSTPWVFVAADPNGKPVRSVTVQFTNQPANSCIRGDWRKITVLSQLPLSQPPGNVTPEPAYLVEGSALTINFTANHCDVYTEMQGQLTPVGFSGKYFFLGLKRTKYLGFAYGAPVRESGT